MHVKHWKNAYMNGKMTLKHLLKPWVKNCLFTPCKGSKYQTIANIFFSKFLPNRILYRSVGIRRINAGAQ